MIQNAKQLPKVYFGMHFYPGVAQYEEPGKAEFRIMLNERTLRQMDETFQGCPVYVRHREQVDMPNLQQEADGYVVRSFYNEADGKHWVEFMVVSDAGHAAVAQGWKLSNAYVPEELGPGGTWNAVPYDREVVKGRFEHLALVPDPRYQDSVVLTPAQFRAYNDQQVAHLRRVANSGETRGSTRKTLLNFFKKTKVENSDEINEIQVTLEDGRTLTIAELVKIANASDAPEKKAPPAPTSQEEKEKQGKADEPAGSAPQMANMEHHVQRGDKTVPLSQLMQEHDKLCGIMDAMSAHHAKLTQSATEDGGEKDAEKPGAAQDADLTATNADEDGAEKEADAQLEEADKTRKNGKDSKHFNDLRQAHESQPAPTVELDLDRVSRGQRRYGSGN